MNYPCALRAAAVAAALGAGSVFAQTTPPVMTDVAPLPAEDRSSPGAIVLEGSLARAQRDNAFQRSVERTGVGTVGRGVLRTTARVHVESDLAQAREAEALELYQRGSGALIKK